MSELTVTTYQRQIGDVTQDIRRKTGEFLVTAIEIGRLLFEAKSMVEPGGWSKYIEEELPFSHSWANNYMKLYTEFGSDQTSLFGNSQAFMKLRPTQALEVLRLPEEQREGFVESHNVEEMSTRQLKQAVQEQLEAERRLHAQTKEELETAEANLRDANQNLLDTQGRLASAKSTEENARKKVEMLEAALKTAKADAAAAKEETENARKNPDIPESMMEQLRREAEAAAAEKDTGQIRKQLEKANADLAKEREKTKAIEERLAAAQKKSDPDMVECNVMAQKLRMDFNSLLGYVKKINAGDREKGERMIKFLRLLVKAWAEALGMEVKDG